MAFTATPGFVQSINSSFVQVTAANTNLDGTGTIATLWTAGSNGGMIFEVIIKAIVTTSAGMIRLYENVSGTLRLFHEEAIPVVTKSASVPAFEVRIPLYMPFDASQVVGVSTEIANAMNIFVRGGNF